MGEEDYVISVSPTPEQLAQVTQDENFVYGNYNQQGNGISFDNYAEGLFNSLINSPTPPANVVNPESGTGLINTLKNNAKSSNQALNDVAKVLHEGNVLNQRSVQAIENMGTNIMGALNMVSQVLNLGNKISNTHNKLYNSHSGVQSEKNYMQIEQMKYQSQGHSTLVDSKGDPIKPREVQAKYHAEKAMDEERMNKLNWNDILNGINNESDSMNELGVNLFEELVNIHKLDETSIKKIDDEISKIY